MFLPYHPVNLIYLKPILVAELGGHGKSFGPHPLMHELKGGFEVQFDPEYSVRRERRVGFDISLCSAGPSHRISKT